MIKRIFNLIKGRKSNSEEPQKLESVSDLKTDIIFIKLGV
ncbi:hypothetical protein J22TS1_22090 [Siminovitchia terrae]|nr:hypothetical protein J22TS1_22090 [Siminovitchia terrae]